MAGYNNYTYNRGLESLRNKVDQRIYQKRMQLIQERKQAKSVRSMFDIFFNAEARERAGGDNWFETTLNAAGEWFNHNFAEWFRNPASGLLNNLSAIGSDLDYAANLIKAPLIAMAKGEDVGERLKDAYGLGTKGRIDQNMSELREVLGANDPSAEIGTTTGFGALSGAEIGSKGGPLGALIGAVVGAGVGLINSSIDVGVRESGTDNSFLKGTQTVCNTISDMIMEYGADPANFFGGIGNINEFNKTKELTKDIAKGVSDNTVTNLANKEPACLDAFRKSAKGERAFKSNEILAVEYHRAAQLAQQPIKKGNKEIIRTAEQQRKFVEKRIKNVIHSYMNGDKKTFNKNIIETGIGKFLSDDEKVLTQQIDSIYKVLRQEANMSKVGRFAAFINNFDADFAKTLYKGTVPGLTINMAQKAIVKAHDSWEAALLNVAKQYEKGDIVTPTHIPHKDSILEKAARQHYFKQFDELGIKYNITDDMSAKQVAEAYESMSNGIIIFNTNKQHREAKILQGIRRNLVLKNDYISIKLGDAEDAIKRLNKHNQSLVKLSEEDIKHNVDTILNLFYFEEGIKFFEDTIYNPATFKGDVKDMLNVVEHIINEANKTITNSADYKYKTLIDKISNTTFKWDEFNNDVDKFYNDKLHDAILSALNEQAFRDMDTEARQQFLNDMDTLVNRQDIITKETIDRINDYIDNGRINSELKEILAQQEYDLLPGDALSDATVLLHNYNNVEELTDNIRTYQDFYKEARQGAFIRQRYTQYSKAIDNTENIIKEAESRSKVVYDAAARDSDRLQRLRDIHISDLYQAAAKQYKETGNISDDLIKQLSESTLSVLEELARKLNDINPTSYDITMTEFGKVGKGSTQMFNIISRSRIKKPSSITDMTDEQWFLKNFKEHMQKALDIDRNPDVKFRSVKHNLNITNKYLHDNSIFYMTLSSLQSAMLNSNEHKRISKNIIDYIMGNTNELDKSIISAFNSQKLNIKLSKDATKDVDLAEFVDMLDSIKNNLGTSSSKLYNEIVSAFKTSFVNGRSFKDDFDKVLDVLKFASDKDGINMRNGDFVDNFIQQTVFKDTIDAIGDIQYLSNKNARDLYKEVFKNIQIDDTARKTIYDSLDALYNKRAELINDLVELENESASEKLQLELITKFKKETDELYDKLNSLTKVMFMDNLDSSKFTFEGAIGGKLQSIFNLSNIKLPKKQRETIIEAFLRAANDKVLATKDVEYINRFFSKFFNEKGEQRTIEKLFIKDGKYHIKFTDATKGIYITSTGFSQLFDSIGGLEKSVWLRNQIIDYLGLDKSFKETIKLGAPKNRLTTIYTNNLNKMLLNESQSLDENTIKEFNKMIKGFNDNVTETINFIEDTEKGINPTSNMKTKYMKSQIEKANRFDRHFVDNAKNKELQQMVKQGEYKIWDEPYISNIRLGNNKVITKKPTINDLYDYKNDYDFIDKVSKPIIDLETNPIIRDGRPDWYKDSDVYQATIRVSDDEHYNIMILNPQLTNEYKAYSEKLLDADYVNGNFMNIPGAKLGKSGPGYRTYIVNGVPYMLFDTKASAAEFMENLFIDKGMLTKDGVLQFVGHNSSDFDAPVLLNFLNKYGTGKVKSVDTADTMWLSRAIMASEMGAGFEDDPSVNLENLYRHWIGEPEAGAAHNASYDTKMTMELRDYIKNKLGEEPSKFFKENLNSSIDIPYEHPLNDLGILDASSIIEEESNIIKVKDTNEILTIYKSHKLEGKELFEEFKKQNKAYNERYNEVVEHNKAVILQKRINKGYTDFTEDDYKLINKFNLKSNSNDTEWLKPWKYPDKPKFAGAFGNYKLENNKFDKSSLEHNIITNTEFISTESKTITDEFRDKILKEFEDIQDMIPPSGRYNIKDFAKLNKRLQEFNSHYYEYLNDDTLNLIDKVDMAYSKAYETYMEKLNYLHGTSKVIPQENREETTARVLAEYSLTMSEERANAINEVLYLLSNDSKTIEKTSKELFNTKIGTITGYLLKQYNYNLDAFYNDHPRIKLFKGYTNRINAHIKFKNEMDNVFNEVLVNANPKDIGKYKRAFSGIMGDLMGFRRYINPSIDSALKNYIKDAKLEDLADMEALSTTLHNLITKDMSRLLSSKHMKVFDEDSANKMADIIKNYVDNCLDNLADYSLGIDKRGYNALTILRPTPDSQYINNIVNALGKRGLLGTYQSKVDPIIAEKADLARVLQNNDEYGLMDVAHDLRIPLSSIDEYDEKYAFTVLPRAYVEQLNGMTIDEINNSMNTIAFKSADNYTDEMSEIIEDRNYIYNAFDIKYDTNKTRDPYKFKNVESEFTKITRDIKKIFKLNSYQMQDIADIASLTDDPTFAIKKQLFIDYFNDLTLTDEEQELYERFLDKLLSYKFNETPNDPEGAEKIKEAVKAYFGAAKLEEPYDFTQEAVNARNGKPLTKMQNLINHTARYAQESNRMINELFRDESGNINYALMAKYIKSNPYMKVVAMIPSDRFNNVDKQTKQAQMASEFVTTDFDSVESLRVMLNHNPEKDGIRYFVVDKHNLMTLKKMISQSTSNKTYTGRTLFKNNPHMQRMMHFRDVVAKYVLLPTKVLGLQNLGFTVTNAIEGFLKTMVATEGNKLHTVSRYKDAITWHKNWSRATGIIAEAIQGSPFCFENNQWLGMLKELDNSKTLFGDDIKLLKELWNKLNIEDIDKLTIEDIKKLDMKAIRELLPSIDEFKAHLGNTTELTNFNKRELINKYTKLWNKTEEEQNKRILVMLQRYIKTADAYDEITKSFNKEQFDFVSEFVNSPAAAAEMQSIKKANELNLIGNKQRLGKDGKAIKKDDPLTRFYKKALFSDWGLGKHDPLRVITPYYNLSLNSDIETINRLALHMDLLDKGYTHSESYNRVLETFFNYGDKPEGELIAELFFPFISFPLRTTLFWDKMLDEHPELIKIYADLVLTNWGKDAQNQYNQTGITKGGLKITPILSMESGSSFLDSLVFGGNALNVLRNRKLNPLLGPLVEGAKQLTIGGDSNWDYRLSRLPIVSKVMYGNDLVENLNKGNTALYDIAPSVFHKVYKDNIYYYNNAQRYNYRSIYSRLYTATGYNRWNTRTTKGRVNAGKYLQGLK